MTSAWAVRTGAVLLMLLITGTEILLWHGDGTQYRRAMEVFTGENR